MAGVDGFCSIFEPRTTSAATSGSLLTVFCGPVFSDAVFCAPVFRTFVASLCLDVDVTAPRAASVDGRDVSAATGACVSASARTRGLTGDAVDDEALGDDALGAAGFTVDFAGAFAIALTVDALAAVLAGAFIAAVARGAAALASFRPFDAGRALIATPAFRAADLGLACAAAAFKDSCVERLFDLDVVPPFAGDTLTPEVLVLEF